MQAVAGLLNATLVIPRFDLHNIWKDPSEFADIYDDDHFISTLKDYVTVVRDLPKDLIESYALRSVIYQIFESILGNLLGIIWMRFSCPARKLGNSIIPLRTD